MGVLNGSISYTRFYVEGEVPKDFREAFVERVKLNTFEPLKPEDESEESMGWCSVEHPLDLELGLHKFLYNEYVNLGLRIDTWRLPSSLLKAHFVEEERKYLTENGKDRLSRSEKENIKDFLVAKFKRRMMPSMKVVDMSWNLHTGYVRFWNQSPKMCEIFAEFFEKTFDLPIAQDNPYVAALHYDLDDAQVRQLGELEASVFHDPDTVAFPA